MQIPDDGLDGGGMGLLWIVTESSNLVFVVKYSSIPRIDL
jgi:hypothetical protein